MSLSLSVYPSFSVFMSLCWSKISVFLSFCLSVLLSVFLSIRLSFNPSIRRSVRLSVCLSICLSVFLSFCLPVLLYFRLSVVSLSFCLSVCPSIRLSVVFLLFSVLLSFCSHLSAFRRRLPTAWRFSPSRPASPGWRCRPEAQKQPEVKKLVSFLNKNYLSLEEKRWQLFEVIKERQKQKHPEVKKLEHFVNKTLFVFRRKKVIAFWSN